MPEGGYNHVLIVQPSQHGINWKQLTCRGKVRLRKQRKSSKGARHVKRERVNFTQKQIVESQRNIARSRIDTQSIKSL